MDNKEVRLRILEILIPQSTRVGLTDPEVLIKKASLFENYVVGSTKIGAESDAPIEKKKTRRPRRTTVEDSSLPSDPTHGG